jgi:hypothetical protein
MDVAYRILFNTSTRQPVGLAPLFGALMERINALKVPWDLTVMHHREGNWAVEVVLFRNDGGNDGEARMLLVEWLNEHGLQYRVLGDVVG